MRELIGYAIVIFTVVFVTPLLLEGMTKWLKK